MNVHALQKQAEPTPRLHVGLADIFTFTCCDCGREERRPSLVIPEGWILLEMDCSGVPFVRCPDCITGAATDDSASVQATEPPPFQIFLEKQTDGRYLINMAPETVLMRLLPLTFFLSAGEARHTARELSRYAALLEARGTLPAEVGRIGTVA